MNNYLTYTAAAKLLRLIDSKDCECVSVEINDRQINMHPLEEASDEFNIQISNFPKVFTNLKSMYYLKKYSIDFDYQTDSFIVSI